MRPISSSSPDVVLVPLDLALSLSWSVVTTLNSDHLPITVNFDNDSPPSRSARCFTNFKKADWEAFKLQTEDRLYRLPLPTSCSEGEKVWRQAIQKISSRSIPAGFRSEFTLGLDADSQRLVEERDQRHRAVVGLGI